MKKTATITHTCIFNGEELEFDILVKLAKNGIGAYEFWGQSCYDAGSDCIDDYEILPVMHEGKATHIKDLPDALRDLICESAEKYVETDHALDQALTEWYG
jgi:hypothetical protein